MNIKINQMHPIGTIQMKEHQGNIAKSAGKAESDTAAVVNLSKAGRYKARLLAKDERIKEAESQAEAKAESQIDNILDTVRSGGVLTKDEERILNEELKSLAAKQHSNMKNYKLDPNDEGVLEALKENYLQRQKIFDEMQKEVQAAGTDGADREFDRRLASMQQESEEKERLIEVLEESVRSEEESEEDTEEVSGEKPEEKQEIHITMGEEQAESDMDSSQVKTKQDVLQVLEKNQNNISDVKAKSQSEFKKEREYAQKLDSEYEKITELLDNEEVTTEEKVAAYDDYMTNSKHYAHEREIQRLKRNFDAETHLIAKIYMNSHDDFDEINKNNENLYGQLGTEFIKKFLI